MSRSGYTEELETLEFGRWRAQVASAIRGKRGQRFLLDLLKALDQMPEKRLITDELENAEGEVCALGALGKARGIEMQALDPEDYDHVAEVFNIAFQLVCEIEFMNDDWCFPETPEQRHQRMRKWTASLIQSERDNSVDVLR